MIGTIVSWAAPKTPMKTEDLKQAARDAGLEEKIVREISYRNAFKRAVSRIPDAIVRKVDNQGDKECYQVTREYKSNGEFHYSKTCTLIVSDGKVESSNGILEQEVRDSVDYCIEHQNSSDMTRMIQRSFTHSNYDLVPLRPQGGVYFVPEEQSSLVETVRDFVTKIGGTLFTYKLTPEERTAESVSMNMSKYLKGLLEDLRSSCDSLNSETPTHVLQRRCRSFAKLKAKVEAHSEILQSMASNLKSEISNAEIEALNKMASA